MIAARPPMALAGQVRVEASEHAPTTADPGRPQLPAMPDAAGGHGTLRNRPLIALPPPGIVQAADPRRGMPASQPGVGARPASGQSLP